MIALRIYAAAVGAFVLYASTFSITRAVRVRGEERVLELVSAAVMVAVGFVGMALAINGLRF